MTVIVTVSLTIGQLCEGGVARVVVTAGKSLGQGWTGDILVYSDNSVRTVPVAVRSCPRPSQLVAVSPGVVQMGLVVVGSAVSATFQVTSSLL